MRPIDANAFDKRISFVCQSCSGGICEYCKLGELQSILSDMPTLEPKVRHGRWIPIEYDSYADGAPVWDKYECSECGHEHKGEEDTLTAFCPDCGAKME